MKHIFLLALASCALIISLSSCEKESPDAVPADQQYPAVKQYPVIINLVAGRWIKNEQGIYVDTFQNVIRVPTTGHPVRIYQVSNHVETLINQQVSFMDGTLWATHTNGNVEIDFVPEGRIFPFSYLIIKIEIL